jgi:glycogen operon protein
VFLHAQKSKDGIKDITWLGPDGHEKAMEEWHDPEQRVLGLMLNSEAQELDGENGEVIVGEIIFIVFNAQADPVTFAMPALPRDGEWVCVLDTAAVEGPIPPPVAMGQGRHIDGRSLVVHRFEPSDSHPGSVP